MPYLPKGLEVLLPCGLHVRRGMVNHLRFGVLPWTGKFAPKLYISKDNGRGGIWVFWEAPKSLGAAAIWDRDQLMDKKDVPDWVLDEETDPRVVLDWLDDTFPDTIIRLFAAAEALALAEAQG